MENADNKSCNCNHLGTVITRTLKTSVIPTLAPHTGMSLIQTSLTSPNEPKICH